MGSQYFKLKRCHTTRYRAAAAETKMADKQEAGRQKWRGNDGRGGGVSKEWTRAVTHPS